MRTKQASALVALTLATMLAGCGGGGGDAGATPFSSSSSGSGTSNTGPGGAVAGGGLINVSTGLPNQRAMSLAIDKWGLDWSQDGDKATVTVIVSDTAGNPVPDGTVVQFSVSGGQIVTSCKLTGVKSGTTTISSCTAAFSTSNPRPTNGYVALVAWMEGEEAFSDLNGNGKYDAGEPFYEGGAVFRDDDLDGAYTDGVDYLVVSGSLGQGSSACRQDASVYQGIIGFKPLSKPNTCDGVWGKTYVRANVRFPVSYPTAMGVEEQAGVAGDADGDGLIYAYSSNPAISSGAPKVSAPSGTTIAVTNVGTGGGSGACSGATPTPATLPDVVTGPHPIQLVKTPAGCTGAVTVSVTLTKGSYTSVPQLITVN